MSKFPHVPIPYTINSFLILNPCFRRHIECLITHTKKRARIIAVIVLLLFIFVLYLSLSLGFSSFTYRHKGHHGPRSTLHNPLCFYLHNSNCLSVFNTIKSIFTIMLSATLSYLVTCMRCPGMYW